MQQVTGVMNSDLNCDTDCYVIAYAPLTSASVLVVGRDSLIGFGPSTPVDTEGDKGVKHD